MAATAPAVAPRPTVLLVEDDPDVREILAAALSKRFKLLVAESGSRALPIVRLAVTQMKTRKYGDVARPCFEVVGWEDDGPAVNTGAMRTVNVSDIPDVPDLDPPPHDGEDLPF